MGLFEKARFHLWDGIGFVSGLIDNWKPGKLRTEQQYEKSLYEYLHGHLEDIQVTRQYAKGRIRADIVVGDKVIIELKNNLDSTSKYQRLVGQINEYKNWEGHILILLCGETDPNIYKDLKKHASELNNSSLDIEEKISIKFVI